MHGDRSWRATGAARPTRLLVAVLAALMAVGLAVAPALPAGADTVDGERAHAKQLSDQIDALGNQESTLAEKYDAAVLAQAQAGTDLVTAQKDLDAAAGRAHQVGAALRDLAVRAYIDGGGTVARSHADGGDPLLAVAYLEATEGTASQTLGDARAAHLDLIDRTAKLKKAKASVDATVKAVAASKHSVSATEVRLEAALAQSKGRLGDLVAQEQAARQARDAAAALARVPRARAVAASIQPADDPGPVLSGHGGAGTALAYARAQLGKPYRWGADGPGSFDCSGLTMRAWGAAGVSLPHNAAAQYRTVQHIPFSALQPGDLVFESSLGHVGIYVGGGMLLHAPHTGDVVRISPLWGAMRLAGRP